MRKFLHRAALARSNGLVSRFQFSLRTLLVAALVLPPAGYWVLRSRQAANAAHDYLAAQAFCDVGTATFEQVYDCSRRLRDAEIAAPFSNRRAALIGYLNRLAHFEQKLKALLVCSTHGRQADDEWNAQLAAMITEREALEAELGIAADAAKSGIHVPSMLGRTREVEPEFDP